QACPYRRPPWPIPQERMDARQQKDTEYRWLQAEAQHILAGDSSLEIPGIINAEKRGRGEPQQSRVNDHKQRDESQPGPWLFVQGWLANPRDAKQTVKIQSQDQEVIEVEQVFMDVLQLRRVDALPIRECDQEAENGGGILGFGQPILVEVAQSRLGQ